MDKPSVISRYLDFLKYEQGASVHTVVAYAHDLERWLEVLGWRGLDETSLETKLFALHSRQARKSLLALTQAGDSPQTLHRRVSALRGFYTYLQRCGCVESNPFSVLPLPKKGRRLPPFVNATTLTTHVKSLYDRVPGAAQEERYGVFLEAFIVDLLFQTGLRRSELTGLSLSRVDLEGAQLKVWGKRNKERIVPFGALLLDKIKVYLQYREALCSSSDAFLLSEKGEPLTDSRLYRIVRKALEGLESYTKRSPHVLRHSFASAMLNGGAELINVKELLGHESISTTSIYTHTTFEELREMYNAHPRGKKKKS